MVVSVVRIFLIRQKRQIRQIQLYGNQALEFCFEKIPAMFRILVFFYSELWMFELIAVN